MLRRLKKLGIDKTDPNELTPEEITRFGGVGKGERVNRGIIYVFIYVFIYLFIYL